MSLKSINPTETKSWSKLKDHFNDIKETHINDYFTSNNDRANQLSITFDNFHFDFSKNKINSETISLFNDLLTEIDLKSSIEKYFGGEKINSTESRAVLHTALRSSENEEIILDEKNIITKITKAKDELCNLWEMVDQGQLRWCLNLSIRRNRPAGSLTIDQEQYMLLEFSAKQLEKVTTEMESMMDRNVNKIHMQVCYLHQRLPSVE